MRILISVATAGAIVAATPALAQDNAAANAAAANAAATNEAAPLNATTSMPAGPTAGGQPATQPATATTDNQAGTAPVGGQKPGFPWGVLGLLGLVGLFGRKRSS